MTYDPGNIFARILAGEARSHRVLEDEHALAIMDVMPRCEGHTLILPKAPSVNFLDLPADSIAGVFAATQRVARAAKEAFAADGIQVSLRNRLGCRPGCFPYAYSRHALPPGACAKTAGTCARG